MHASLWWNQLLRHTLNGTANITSRSLIRFSKLHNGDHTVNRSRVYTQTYDCILNDFRQDLSVLEVFYDDSAFRSYVRDEFIGFTEFLSNTGGLLGAFLFHHLVEWSLIYLIINIGLFMGFSVVSLVEIFYFIALRPYFSRFSPENIQKSAPHIVSTVSKLKLKNQHHHILPPTRLYEREYLNNHFDPTLPFYRRNFPNIDVNLWKPTPFVHWKKKLTTNSFSPKYSALISNKESITSFIRCY